MHFGALPSLAVSMSIMAGWDQNTEAVPLHFLVWPSGPRVCLPTAALQEGGECLPGPSHGTNDSPLQVRCPVSCWAYMWDSGELSTTMAIVRAKCANYFKRTAPHVARQNWGFWPHYTWTAKQTTSAWPLWTFIIQYCLKFAVLPSKVYCYHEHYHVGEIPQYFKHAAYHLKLF